MPTTTLSTNCSTALATASVESINNDKPYDQMVVEMLAGDEVAPGDEETVRATGYLARSWYKFNRNVWLRETAEYTATSFLGLTLKCVCCHDHKYDPLLQTDYYRFRAFFEPYEIRKDRVPGEPDTMKAGLSRAYDADPGAQTYRFIRGNEKDPDEYHPLDSGVPRMFGAGDLNIQPVELPRDVYYPAVRAFVHKNLLAKAHKGIEEAENNLSEAKKELDEAKRKLTASGRSAEEPVLLAGGNRAIESRGENAEVGSQDELAGELHRAKNKVALTEKRLIAARVHIPALEARIEADKAKHGLLADADVDALGETALKKEREARILKAEADILEARQELTEALLNPNPKTDDEEKDGAAKKEEKKEVEKKFADEKRIKQAQGKLQSALDALKGPGETYTAIGEGIVPTMFNFGSSGQPPSNPELLDWLAVEFMKSGWSQRHMHRLMVTSNTYRMRSWSDADNLNRAKDQDNIYLWRMNTRRMEAEAVRDSLLYLSGELDSEMGGLEIPADEDQSLFRRSLYFQHTPDTQMTFLSLWDAASPNECFRRSESITPHQALSLSNSPLSFQMSRVLAGVLNDKVGEAKSADSDFVHNAFDLLLGRPPSANERKESQDYIREQAKLYASTSGLEPFDTGEKNEKVPPASDPRQRARESFVHVMFNHNEFVTIR